MMLYVTLRSPQKHVTILSTLTQKGPPKKPNNKKCDQVIKSKSWIYPSNKDRNIMKKLHDPQPSQQKVNGTDWWKGIRMKKTLRIRQILRSTAGLETCPTTTTTTTTSSYGWIILVKFKKSVPRFASRDEHEEILLETPAWSSCLAISVVVCLFFPLSGVWNGISRCPGWFHSPINFTKKKSSFSKGYFFEKDHFLPQE